MPQIPTVIIEQVHALVSLATRSSGVQTLSVRQACEYLGYHAYAEVIEHSIALQHQPCCAYPHLPNTEHSAVVVPSAGVGSIVHSQSTHQQELTTQAPELPRVNLDLIVSSSSSQE